MKRFIRWQGVVGFISIVVLIAVFVYLFANSLVKSAIEKSGEWYLGAEVNVESVDISYQPLTLEIKGFQATDPEKPSHNLVSFNQASAGINLWPYLFGKIHMSELSIDQIKIDQQRQSPGKVYQVAKESEQASAEQKEDAALSATDASLPNVKDLLKRS